MTKSILMCAGDGVHARQILVRLIEAGIAPLAIFSEVETNLAATVNAFLRDGLMYWPESIKATANTHSISLIETSNLFSTETKSKMLALSPDYLICGGCGVVPDDLITSMSGRVLNAHPGILPDFRGLDPVLWTLSQRMPVGATLHFVDSNLDSGPIIKTEKLNWQNPSTLTDCRIQCSQLCAELVVKFLSAPQCHIAVEQNSQMGNYYGPFPDELKEGLNSVLAEYHFSEESGNVWGG